MTRPLTNEEFLEKLRKVNQSVEPLEEYVCATKKIKVRCKKCGYVWNKRPQGLLVGQGCPKCGRKKQIAAMAETKRKSHDQFAKELADVNDKVKLVGQYTYAQNRVEVMCIDCGRHWLAFPGNLLHGAGCRDCASKRHRISEEDFVDRLHKIDPSIALVSGYVMASEKAQFRCLKCGHEWDVLPTSLLAGTGCPECAKGKIAEKGRKSPEEYARQFAEINPTLKLLSAYTGSANHVDVECLVCGYKWSAPAQHLLGDTGCPSCAGNVPYTQESFIEKVKSHNPNIQIDGKYRGNKKRIDVHCTVCGHKWSPTAGSLAVGQGCPKCAGILKKTNEQFLEELAKVNTSVTPLEEYDGADKSIKVKCNKCGHVWSVAPYALLHGGGCPECTTVRNSFFEHAILFAAQEALGKENVLHRDRASIGVELDVYIPSLKVAFEPGSWYYHKSRVDIDKGKQEKCHTAGIKLYTIYSSYNESVPAPEWCVATSSTLGSFDWNDAMELISQLFRECGIDTTNIKWNRVYKRAIMRTGRRTTEQFVERMSHVNSDIIIEGSYTGARNRVAVRCKKCGHTWKPTASSLLSGHGCPKCKGVAVSESRRKSQEQYVDEVAAIDSNIEVIGEYRGYDYNVDLRCKACGYEWSPRAGYILEGHHCPQCSNTIRKTHDDFIERMKQINPNVQINSKYAGTKHNVKAKCLVCGHEWETAAGNLLSGKGCPKCGRKKCDEARNKTHDKFVQQLGERNPDVEAVGEYKKAREKMEFKCRKCGHTWYATPDNILRGRGCPKCKRSKKRKFKE